MDRLILLAGGALTAGLALPGEETDFFGDTVDTGSPTGFAIGLIAAAVGQLIVLVASVASGVALSVRSSRT